MKENTGKKKGRKMFRVIRNILFIILGIVLLLFGALVFLRWDLLVVNFHATNFYTSYFPQDKVKPYMVFAKEVNVVQKISEDHHRTIKFDTIGVLHFSEIVAIEINNHVNNQGQDYYKIVSSSHNSSGYKKSEKIYLEASLEDLVEDGYTEEFLTAFPNTEAQQLPAVPVKRSILDYLTSNNIFGDYGFTQDPNQIKKAIVLADFNMDGEQDVAVVLENKYESSRLLVFCYNKDLKKSYLAYSEYASCPAAINLFNKDAKIFINSEILVKAPNNGIIYQILGCSTQKFAVFYNPKMMRFEKYLQVPLSEIQSDEDKDEVIENE